MRRLIFLFALFLLLINIREKDAISYEIELKEAESEFGLEDLNGRIAWERLLASDPNTGKIPENIRAKELAFARQNDLKSRGLGSQVPGISSAGPFNVGGRTRAVALDIRDENVILAGGISGGVWKSLDGGMTWARKSDPENRNSVTCLVQDTRPGREDTWYHGTGEIVGNSTSGGAAPFRGDGIFKSTDNGETWNQIASTQDSDPTVFNSQFQYIWDIEVNDRNLVDDEIIVAAFGGILRSLDGGDTWSVEVGQSLFNLDPSVNLNEIPASFYTALEKTSDGVFYATLSLTANGTVFAPGAGIYISKDGDNWFRIDQFSSLVRWQRIEIGSSKSNPDLCYFLVDANQPLIFRYDLNSFNTVPTGEWTNLSENIPAFGGDLGELDTQGSFNMVIRVHPEDENLVFVGGTNLYRSRDGFSSSENTDWIGGYNPEGGSGVYLNHHPDLHDLIFFPSDPGKMLSASDGGLILTEESNADSVMWDSRNNGFLTSQFYTVALSKEENDDHIMGGMQDNGTDISSGTSNWDNLLGGDGGYAATTPDKTLWFASFQRGQTYRLTLNEEFGLTSFARIDPGGLVAASGSAYLFINPFILDPANPNRMFIAGGNQLYVNNNISQIPGGSQEPTGTGWKAVDDSQVASGVISAIDISTDGTTVYYGSTNGLLKKIDDAKRINPVATDITSSQFPENSYISSIGVNPDNDDHLLVVFSNYGVPSVFESLDGGASFIDISGSLEEFADGTGSGPSVRWCELIPLNSGVLCLAGTSTGLYSTMLTAGTSTVWIRESSNLLGSAVVTMMDYRPLDGRLAIATHGNGVFTTTVSDFKKILFERPGEQFADPIAYPNPFKVSTQISYTIPEDGEVKIDLFSTKGEFVKNLLWAPQFAGANTITWDGSNTSGTPLANGIYLYRVEYAGTVKTGRISLRK
ncbi:MAG: FlgD immunoglobulin-like domain containing protein [Cyclobacteriaceae bacterium]